ncbi:MAG: hypothetical protein PWR22_1114 [Moorella sp. (in: firmicutes)]|jgi:hypothetical protein|uniref:DUF4829 domain-containing protein n=1 Tax=Moorella sp. E306M TaxID=2572683 RepID=UPI0010FFAF9C|nr:DUF4829 domain-containing protein [Moorella sp. E306M]MDK2816485.1 hypothetical protein [Moorella sp. (in: firmicutes)]GEA18090.1 hypothetical protein E306M_12260 [Moorella sp. E306M]
MRRGLSISLAAVFIILILGGCQTRKETAATFNEFKDEITGLEFYVTSQAGEEPRQAINLVDKQLTQRFLHLLGPLPKIDPPPKSWYGSKDYLAFKYIRNGETIASKQYPYWHQDNNPGYLKLEDGWRQVPAEFAAKLAPLAEYPDASSDIDPADAAFLKQYGWTVFYKIKSYNGRLPERFIHESGEYPVSLYYAYNNELSKDVGLDLSPYLGKSVTVNLYKIEEPLPAFMAPRQEANRAVIVKDGPKIIGAWLDAGRHYAFACSLKGRRLEEITGKTWGEWVDQYIDHDNPQEKLISQMTPEKVIETYYEAIDNKDPRTAHATETRRRLVSYLFRNMDNNRLYNYSYATNDADEINNITRAKVIRIQPYHDPSSEQADVKKYVVEVDINVRRVISYDSGRQIRFITLRRETPTTGWRIDDIGTGP